MSDVVFERVHHVQVAIPVGGEDSARAFWVELLGFAEVPKPPVMAARGGCWFRAPGGGLEMHMGVEQPFAPARKAHPGILIAGLNALATRLEDAGYAVRWSDEIPGTKRFHTDDPFGNRLEFIDAGA